MNKKKETNKNVDGPQVTKVNMKKSNHAIKVSVFNAIDRYQEAEGEVREIKNG